MARRILASIYILALVALFAYFFINELVNYNGACESILSGNFFGYDQHSCSLPTYMFGGINGFVFVFLLACSVPLLVYLGNRLRWHSIIASTYIISVISFLAAFFVVGFVGYDGFCGSYGQDAPCSLSTYMFGGTNGTTFVLFSFILAYSIPFLTYLVSRLSARWQPRTGASVTVTSLSTPNGAKDQHSEKTTTSMF